MYIRKNENYQLAWLHRRRGRRLQTGRRTRQRAYPIQSLSPRVCIRCSIVSIVALEEQSWHWRIEEAWNNKSRQWNIKISVSDCCSVSAESLQLMNEMISFLLPHNQQEKTNLFNGLSLEGLDDSVRFFSVAVDAYASKDLLQVLSFNKSSVYLALLCELCAFSTKRWKLVFHLVSAPIPWNRILSTQRKFEIQQKHWIHRCKRDFL